MATTPIEVSRGQKTVLFFQDLTDKTTDGNKLRLAFQTDHSISRERESYEEATKDGTIKGTGAENASIDITCYVARGDSTQALIKDCYTKNKRVQAWEVDITVENKTTNKYPALYAQGYFTNYDTSSGVDGYTELSTTLAIDMSPQDGEVTLTPQAFSDVQYAFHDFGELATAAGL